MRKDCHSRNLRSNIIRINNADVFNIIRFNAPLPIWKMDISSPLPHKISHCIYFVLSFRNTLHFNYWKIFHQPISVHIWWNYVINSRLDNPGRRNKPLALCMELSMVKQLENWAIFYRSRRCDRYAFHFDIILLETSKKFCKFSLASRNLN